MADDKTAELGAPVAPASRVLGSKLLDQAKKAGEQAAAKAADLAAKAGEMKAEAGARAGEMKDQAAAMATGLKDASVARMNDVLDEFNDALPVIREAGYALESVVIGLGLPPKTSATFTASDVVSEERFAELVAANADRKLTLLLMRSLHEAWRLQTKIRIAGLTPKSITVELGLTPSVSVKFA